mmetsp:Transcript_2370/g.8710  ORF Transcript_2370/g.8710 Transcript_2370/m.8710 type:complete len:629 (+) Transcript_2370:185-2071(+)
MRFMSFGDILPTLSTCASLLSFALSASPVEEEEEEELAQSRVGQKLSDLTTRRVIVMVLLMLLFLQFFEVDTWPGNDQLALMVGGIELLHNMAVQFPECQNLNGIVTSTAASCTENNPGMYNAILSYVDETDDIYSLKIANISYNDFLEPPLRPPSNELRDEELESSTFLSSNAKFNLRSLSVFNAILSLCRTIFVCIILGYFAMSFSKDANELVLAPIERMIKKVKDMSENPLARQKVDVDPNDPTQQFETKILENSITKICSLLAVGFGDAGAEIIAENMRNGGELNPMVPGRKMVAIFGFCDIRQFTDTTEVLQESIMEYVNSIANIVHMEVALHGGSANKNIGDAFLVVFKFPSDVTVEDVMNTSTKGPKRDAICESADRALAAFLVIQAHLRRSARLHEYSKNPGLKRRMPGFKLRMGYGLHVGWAIEGAIGSSYKVDASYLSPNVNMAARLEAATKQFGTPLLLSEDFVNILSPSGRKFCRQIDCVTVKGSEHPMGLHTYDTDETGVPEPEDGEDLNADPHDTTHSLNLKAYKDEFSEHPDISKMRGTTPEFLSTFADGFKAYKEGRWDVAREILTHTSTCRKATDGTPIKDGPSMTLLGVMEEENFRAPPNWAGFRELTEK